MTRSTAILGTTDFLALLYEYEIDIVTGVREVFDDDVEPEQCFTLHCPLGASTHMRTSTADSPVRASNPAWIGLLVRT